MMENRLDFAWIAIVVWCGLLLLLEGCATSRGFGQDLQSLGRSIEKSADRTAE